MLVHRPRLLLSAPASGSGKTCITCGLLEVLKRKGLFVRAYKSGPDYIDPMFHQTVLELPSKNLDTWFCEEETLKNLFLEEDAELSVMEGAMGYFDGLGGVSLQASAYDLARVTKTPVILVINAKGMGRSVAALAKGFVDYEPEKHIKGILLNRVSSMQYPNMKELVEEACHLPVVGYLPECPESTLQSRHLGLVLPEEIADLRKKIKMLADKLEETLDVKLLLQIAEQAVDLEKQEEHQEQEKQIRQIEQKKRVGQIKQECHVIETTSIQIGVARDEAFCFYYADNLKCLEKLGAKLYYFSPIRDQALPEVDGLLFGGGYPELYARELESNVSMREQIQRAAQGGMPILAECGGFMYLQEQLANLHEETFQMAGVLPGKSFYTGKLGRFGYIELQDKDGRKVKGHEFHYFDSTRNGDAFHATKPIGGKQWECMVRKGEILAGFPHIYYPSSPWFAREYIEKCKLYHEQSS